MCVAHIDDRLSPAQGAFCSDGQADVGCFRAVDTCRRTLGHQGRAARDLVSIGLRDHGAEHAFELIEFL